LFSYNKLLQKQRKVVLIYMRVVGGALGGGPRTSVSLIIQASEMDEKVSFLSLIELSKPSLKYD
jgi:hypothetical protein